MGTRALHPNSVQHGGQSTQGSQPNRGRICTELRSAPRNCAVFSRTDATDRPFREPLPQTDGSSRKTATPGSQPLYTKHPVIPRPVSARPQAPDRQKERPGRGREHETGGKERGGTKRKNKAESTRPREQSKKEQSIKTRREAQSDKRQSEKRGCRSRIPPPFDRSCKHGVPDCTYPGKEEITEKIMILDVPPRQCPALRIRRFSVRASDSPPLRLPSLRLLRIHFANPAANGLKRPSMYERSVLRLFGNSRLNARLKSERLRRSRSSGRNRGCPRGIRTAPEQRRKLGGHPRTERGSNGV